MALSIAAVSLVAGSGFSGCVSGRAVSQPERPNLAIAEDTSRQRALISLRQIRVRNLGSVPGEGVVTVAVIDSVGTPLMEVALKDGAPIRLPAASLGGAEGRVVPMSDLAAFENLVDSLARAEARFGVRARIRTTESDADESDNVKTREWGPWLPMAPSAEVTIRFTFAVSDRAGAMKVHLEPLRVPPGASVVAAPSGHNLFLKPGLHTREVRLLTREQLRHGSVFSARLTLTDSVTGEVLQQHERSAVFDTVPPMLSSYRAVMLRDGRIAIQMQAGDRNSGVPESGVATLYSADGGTTWHRQVHGFVEDDFGRPALFETVIGPFPRGTNLFVSARAQDRAGNASLRLPVDARVFAAPNNAELLVDAYGIPLHDGNPVFVPAMIARRAAWVEAAKTSHALEPALASHSNLTAADRFELRRIEELYAVPTSFNQFGVDVSGFTQVDAGTVRLASDHGSEWTALRIRVRK